MKNLERIHGLLSSYLDDVRSHFRTDTKVTLVVRQPDVEGDAGIVIGNDDLDEAIAEIRRRQQSESTTLTGARAADEAEGGGR